MLPSTDPALRKFPGQETNQGIPQDRARYFLTSFGPHIGRFLAKYPKDWKRLVYESLTRPDVEKHRIIERLNALDSRAFAPRDSASYDRSKAWLDNAEAEHARREFRAIVAVEDRGKDYVLNANEDFESDPRWKVHQGGFVAREPARLVQTLDVLLRLSKRVVLVDCYFRADNPDKTRIVVALCRALEVRTSIEIHWSDQADSMPSYAEGVRHAKRVLPPELPNGAKVTLRCLRKKPKGERLHNRFLITDVGGVQFGDSVEVGEEGEHDRISILDIPSLEKLWELHGAGAQAFEEGGPPVEIAGRRRPAT